MKDKDTKKKAQPAGKKAAPAKGAAKAVAPKIAKAAKPAKAAASKAKGKAAPAPTPAAKKASKRVPAPVSAPAVKSGKGKALPAPAQVAPVPLALKGKKGAKGGAAAASSNAKTQAMLKAGLVPVEGSTICREVACEISPTSSGYCRLHYIKNWKRIKKRELLLKEGKLNRYIEELVAKYPEKYIEAIRQDLTSDADFAKVVTDLELDEGLDEFDGDSENIESLIDSIRKDMDDETDLY
ncbi:MAG: hypothetical protein IT285_02245 [Bdellovibrionales bacterium]|nr:hypothetical protein [Bdellovibrionales bacterium]